MIKKKKLSKSLKLMMLRNKVYKLKLNLKYKKEQKTSQKKSMNK